MTTYHYYYRYTMEILEPAPFLFRHGAQIGGLQVFSRNQNNSGSSGVYVTCIYWGLSVKINMRKMPHSTQGSWVHLFCICICVCGRQNPKTPNLSPMADDAIQGDIQGLGSSLFICATCKEFRKTQTPHASHSKYVV